MLKRLYVDNFRSLVNFEIQFDALNLLLGENGSGKSTVFEVLINIRNIIHKKEKTIGFLDSQTLWQQQPLQTIEFELTTNDGIYTYKLLMHHYYEKNKKFVPQIKLEQLSLDDQILLKFQDGISSLYGDDGSKIADYPLESHNSAVALVPERQDTRNILYFKKQIEKWLIVRPVPIADYYFDGVEATYPYSTVKNYPGWYRYLSQDTGFSIKLADDLKGVLSNFDSFNLEPAGMDDRSLVVRFRNDSKQRFSFNFSQLSDGQRMLIILYTLLNLPERDDMHGVTLFIDEPDNFVALREIQPWIRALYDRCNDGDMQAILISHHPETINYLLMPANEQIGYWFERGNLQPTRVKPIATTPEQEGISVSELMALGWFSHE